MGSTSAHPPDTSVRIVNKSQMKPIFQRLLFILLLPVIMPLTVLEAFIRIAVFVPVWLLTGNGESVFDDFFVIDALFKILPDCI